MGSLWSLKGMFVLMFWQIKISMSSKILHLRVGCHIHEGVFSPKGEEEEEERIKDISFLSFHANVRLLLEVTGSSGRQKDGKRARSWPSGVLCSISLWGKQHGVVERAKPFVRDLSLNPVIAT